MAEGGALEQAEKYFSEERGAAAPYTHVHGWCMVRKICPPLLAAGATGLAFFLKNVFLLGFPRTKKG